MATWQHLRSSTANKRPTTSLADGRIAINTNTASPGLFFKDSVGTGLVKVGPVHVGTTAPNSVPAAGGSSGNYTGEQWLDTSVSPAQMKVWNGSTWVGIVADELPVSKLQDGAARQLIQTDAAGTGVEWTSNIDVPGTLDVTSTATFDSIAQYPAGSAAAPTITFTGDTNTGIYSPGADQVAISTNGTGRLFVNASGTVGIGATPISSYPLNIINNGNNFIQFAKTGDALVGSLIGRPSGTADLRLQNSENEPIVFLTNNTERLRITSAGLVGVGTSVPGALVDISGSGNIIRLGDGTNTFDVRFKGPNNWATQLDTSTDTFSIQRNSTSFVTIDGAGRLGVGSTTPQAPLDVTGTGNGGVLSDGAIRAYSANRTAYSTIAYNGIDASTNSGGLLFSINQSEAARIDSSKRLLVGTSSTPVDGRLVVAGNSVFTTGANSFGQLKIRSNTSTPSNGETIGVLEFSDSGSGNSATIIAARDGGTWTTNASNPGRLVFSTTADGASSPTERMRINATGQLLLGKTADAGATAGVVLSPSGLGEFVTSSAVTGRFNRNSSDGTIIEFRQDDVTEGTISVSGTTVSYNGAHLSRWSQLPSGAERTEILRGTVLSNLDEMCEWGEEDNEQLNRMKVSDVEGDKNVSGVFQAWDDDDDTYINDFYCAMTGDFIIRIGEGVTVERGDLLMSAGDGTAKPQDDDIIRSKTIAKVTSTNVSCTYDDGSYCVPCVLMAC